ncbi:MAG: DUF6691 family protein [Persicimonas sp.]
MRRLIAFLSGVIFAVGLAVGGMTQPKKVVDFLDFFGGSNWDPSLAFVMGGAVLVYAIAYRLVIKRQRPLLEQKFHVPTRSDLDWRLVAGGALFGVGWGLGGYCPGPGLTALVALESPAFIFVASMAVGMILFSLFNRYVLEREEIDEATGGL